MAIAEIESTLVALQEANQNNHDGGYGLASAWCEYRKGLPETEAKEWDRVLIGWVGERAYARWAVALESLAMAGGPTVDEELVAILQDGGRDVEFREHLMQALLRRGYVDEFVTAEILGSAQQRSALGLPNLARLVALVPSLTGDVAERIVIEITSGRQKYIEANVPPFVYSAESSNFDLLIRLVEQVFGRDRASGRTFSMMVVKYLEKPFVQKRLGANVTADLIGSLHKVTMN